jgi:hypothetical protein
MNDNINIHTYIILLLINIALLEYQFTWLQFIQSDLYNENYDSKIIIL